MNAAAPADGRLLRRAYTTFYRPDWPWHAGIVVVLLVNLAAYGWVAGAIGRLTELSVAGAGTAELLASAGSLTAGFVVLAALSLLEMGLLFYVVIGRAVARAQPMVLEHALRCPLDFFEVRSPGDLRNVIVDLTTDAATATMGLVKPVLAGVRGLFLVVLMATINVRLALVVIVIIVGYAVFFYYFQRPIGAELQRKAVAERALSVMVDDVHRGFPEIKRNALEAPVLRSFAGTSERWVASSER